ncbi:MAG: hypothetical protein PF961_23875 [Planctomycetota bacterium]|jgi:hypothetical protein|nr:hypothetical protein [Planctomycetota bacterium]
MGSITAMQRIRQLGPAYLVTALALVCFGCGSGADTSVDASSAEPDAAETVTAAADASEPAESVLADGATAVAEVALPALPDGQFECDGTWQGERFWLRLGPSNAAFGGRVLQVLYTQPTPDELGGTLLDPHPWVLLDDALLIQAWMERSRLSQAEYRDDDEPAGYRVRHEIERTVGGDIFTAERSDKRPGPKAWDRRLAPLLLAMVWRSNTNGSVPLLDLFDAEPKLGALRWNDTAVTIAGEEFVVQADESGQLKRLLDTKRKPVLSVRAHLPMLEPDAARVREKAFLEALEKR